MEWSCFNYYFFSKKLNTYLLYNSLTNVLLELNEEENKLLLEYKNDPSKIKATKETKLLFDSKIFVESNISEINIIKVNNLIGRYGNNQMVLTIAPTTQCNFDCFYCYEEERKNIYMNKKTEKIILDYVSNKNSINYLHVCWYGGEPLLAYDTIISLSKSFKSIVKNYSASIITNGYLLDQIIEDLDILALKTIQVTIDGIEETHNKRRPHLTESDSYQKILSNVKNIVKSKSCPQISVRVNIDNENSQDYITIKNTFENIDRKIRTYPAYVVDYTESCKIGACLELEGKTNFLKSLFYEEQIHSSELYPNSKRHGCMMRSLNSLLIDPEANVFKCWHHLGHKKLAIGNLYNKPEFRNPELHADYLIEADSLFSKKCNTCFLFPSCWGGCPELRIKNKKLIGDITCPPFKKNIEDFLEIHYAYKTRIESDS